MKIYYLINTDLGWDNVVAMADTIKTLYFVVSGNEETNNNPTDKECEKWFEEHNYTLMEQFLNT